MIPNRVELLCSRAQEAIAVRDWEKARQFYLLALEFRADAAEVHFGLATVYVQLRDMPNAAYHFHEVTRLDPTRACAFINLGAALHQLGELDDAETALCKGLQLDSWRGEGYYLLGLIHKSRGQFDKALVAFDEALRCNPNWDKALSAQKVARALLSRLPAAKPREIASEEVNGPARTVGPETDGAFLTELHQVTGYAEHKGRLLHKILSEEISPVLIELSRILINSDSSRSDLGACLARFENALERVRSARQGMKEEARKLADINSRLPKK